MRHAHTLGSKETIFYKLFDVLMNEMKQKLPERERKRFNRRNFKK